MAIFTTYHGFPFRIALLLRTVFSCLAVARCVHARSVPALCQAEGGAGAADRPFGGAVVPGGAEAQRPRGRGGEPEPGGEHGAGEGQPSLPPGGPQTQRGTISSRSRPTAFYALDSLSLLMFKWCSSPVVQGESPTTASIPELERQIDKLTKVGSCSIAMRPVACLIFSGIG